MSELRVARPGLQTTVQDLGRWGYQARGVPVAGPMDAWSHRVANALVGNPPDRATLEVTLVGPELVFDDKRMVAVAGAEFEATLDGQPVPMHAAFVASPGSRLAFGRRQKGARAYIAIEGGIEVAPVLGSRATNVAIGMGGLGGRPLRAGDALPLGRSTAPMRNVSSEGRTATRLPSLGPLSDGYARVRVLSGPQQDYFTDHAIATLQAAPYIVGQRSSRMGFRLEGARLAHNRGADIISDATPMGAIQVPASGLPLLLMADRPTTGGYPKIGVVITADLGLAGQLGPGDAISFAVCTPQEAMTALIAQERALMAIEGHEVP